MIFNIEPSIYKVVILINQIFFDIWREKNYKILFISLLLSDKKT